MVIELWRLWWSSIRVARGAGRWWRSPFAWALLFSVAALFSNEVEGGALLAAMAMPLFFVAGLLWMGVMVQLALHGPDSLAGFVLGVVVLAVAMRIGLAISRYWW